MWENQLMEWPDQVTTRAVATLTTSAASQEHSVTSTALTNIPTDGFSTENMYIRENGSTALLICSTL